MKRIGLIGLALIMVFLIWGSIFSTPALSQRIESRLNNLELDVNLLESRLNRLEAIVGGSGRVPAARAKPPGSQRLGPITAPGSREQMFDRLATLVIELKQQVNKLEQRVAKLEGHR